LYSFEGLLPTPADDAVLYRISLARQVPLVRLEVFAEARGAVTGPKNLSYPQIDAGID
jgi:hypothetical protein